MSNYSQQTAHEIDYKILGEEMQCVEIELDPQETAIAESGAFMMMDEGIQMETIFGDGSSQQKGFFGKLMGAGKRLLTGESLFMTAFTNISTGKQSVSFASPYPGKVIPLDLARLGGKMICQKDAFLCAAKGVSVGIEFQRKLGTGLVGGEGIYYAKAGRRWTGICTCRRTYYRKRFTSRANSKNRYRLYCCFHSFY
jgi:uncharacterized protein (AIM24 family)